MKNCPKCGALQADNAETCPSCDQPQAVAAPVEIPRSKAASRNWNAVMLSAVCCGGGQALKKEWLKAILLFPVNMVFYPMSLFALMSIGDYEHPGAAARVLPIYAKVLCITAPIWVWNLVDASKPPTD